MYATQPDQIKLNLSGLQGFGQYEMQLRGDSLCFQAQSSDHELKRQLL